MRWLPSGRRPDHLSHAGHVIATVCDDRRSMSVGFGVEAPSVQSDWGNGLTRLVRKIEPTLTSVAQAAADAEAFCATLGGAESQCLRIGLALDELAANALVHGAVNEASPDIAIEVWADQGLLKLKVTARGPRFDPREHQARPEEAPYALGGRGLTMVIAFADELSFARESGVNVTTFAVTKEGTDDD